MILIDCNRGARVNKAMTETSNSLRDKTTIRATWISLLVSTVVMGSKFYAFALTQSTAILSDAAESVVNVIAAFVAVIVMRVVSAPADEEHPYGHGKLEYFSAAFEGGLIAFASLAIAQEAIRSLLRGESLNQLGMGTVIMAGAAVTNAGLAWYLRKTGREHSSEALIASSQHVWSDVVTSLGVVGGLVLIAITGIPWLDPLIALGVAIHLGFVGYKIVRKSAGGLMDEVETESLEHLVHAFEKNRQDWVIDIHLLKVIRSGNFHHIDGHLVVPNFWDIASTHEKLEEYEKDVVATYPFDGEIAFHIDPCEKRFCSRCKVENCPIRLRPFEARPEFVVQRLTKGPMADGT
jgi:cation diffusion facilitator family transporter